MEMGSETVLFFFDEVFVFIGSQDITMRFRTSRCLPI
jgi:hypothetical protein